MGPHNAIDVPVYRAHVVVYTRREDFAKHRAACTDKTLDLEDCDGISYEKGSVYLVGVFNNAMGVLVHELGHTAFKILRDCGIPADYTAQEAFCYLIEYLYEQCQ